MDSLRLSGSLLNGEGLLPGVQDHTQMGNVEGHTSPSDSITTVGAS